MATCAGRSLFRVKNLTSRLEIGQDDNYQHFSFSSLGRSKVYRLYGKDQVLINEVLLIGPILIVQVTCTEERVVSNSS